MRNLRASRDHLGRVSGRSILGSFWVISEVNLGPILGNLINIMRIALIWPWVGPLASNILNIGSWEHAGWGTGIALPGTLPAPPRVHPPHRTQLTVWRYTGPYPGLNMAVGL